MASSWTAGRPALASLTQQEAEDEPGDKQWADGQDAGQNVILQIAQRVGDDSFHASLLASSIRELSENRLNLSDKRPKPLSQFLFRHHAGCNRQHCAYDRLIQRVHPIPVQIEECFSDDVGRPLIAVEKTMIVG